MKAKVEAHPHFRGIYIIKMDGDEGKIATLNFAPGRRVYDEIVVKSEGKEYRVWNPYRSKLAAAIYNGLLSMPIHPGSRVLYLGAASGTTISHVSDIVGKEGLVYGVEFSSRPMRELIQNVAAHRKNLVPILEDARFPSRYRFLVRDVGIIYCDIAQPEQAKVLAENATVFLEKGGSALIALKARSIDVAKKPREIYEKEIEILKERGFSIEEVIGLEPYEKEHIMVSSKR